MRKKHTLLCLLVLIHTVTYAEDMDHATQGMAHFKKAFYQFTPKHLQSEAALEYAQAIDEFKKAIIANPENVSAYRSLARVYSVQKNHTAAAAAYLKVIALDSRDTDAYVLAALELIESQEFDRAIKILQEAKESTEDEAALQKLDNYITSIKTLNSKRGIQNAK